MKCPKCDGEVHPERGCLLCPMFASGETPGISTDAVYFEGMYSKQAKKFNGKMGCGQELSAPLKAMGGSTTGKIYLSGLAKFPGDPMAWVSDRHDIKRVCEERNLDCEGMVTHKADDRGAKEAEEYRSKKPIHASEVIAREERQAVQQLRKSRRTAKRK